jgi:ADP-ribose pyrophosphatase YjhB (NUDIX family)
MARPRVAAGLLIRDDEGRILLVKPTYKDGWDIPGGYVEPGESPAQAAAREVVEELGVAVPVGRLLVVDWAPHPDEGDKLLFIFDGGFCTEEWVDGLEVDGAEITEARLQTLTSVESQMPLRLSKRLRIAERSIGVASVYAERGELVMMVDL